LYVRRVAKEHVEAWRPQLPGVREVFHARFVDHRYPPHTHDTWTVLVVDQGAIRYDLDHTPHGSVHGTVTVLPPHIVHDGRSARAGGFRKRVLYVETELLGEHLVGPAVDQPSLTDPALARELDRLHRRLATGDDLLGGEASLLRVVERLSTHLGQAPAGPRPPDPRLANRLRQLLDARVFEPLTLRMAGAMLGAHPTHLVRSFAAAYGIPPHAYVVGRRIDAARRALLDGRPAAMVAVETGFHDQAHLHRHFVRHVGTTPGRFRQRPTTPPAG
jgi:AraC-like DNA-binding protein